MAVGKRGKHLVIDFRIDLPDGRRVRTVEYEGENTPGNLKRVHAKWRSIQYHLSNRSFSYLDFFPDGPKASHFKRTLSNLTFSEWWEAWMAGKSLKYATEANYRYIYQKHYASYFGAMKVSEIDDQAVLVFRKQLESRVMASSINQYMKPLCQCLRVAFKKGMAKAFACDDLHKLQESRAKVAPLSFEELRHLLDYWQHKDRSVFDFLFFWAHTGLRPGEVMGLMWDAIDFFNAKLSVTRSLQVNGKIGLPKTHHSVRDIDLRAAVVDVLKRQQERTGLQAGYVWQEAPSKHWVHRTLMLRFTHWLRVAGIAVRPPKNMRHTFATLHIAAGESITWVSKVLGHSDVSITLKRYNRFVPNLTRNDGSAFESVLGNVITKCRVKQINSDQ